MTAGDVCFTRLPAHLLRHPTCLLHIPPPPAEAVYDYASAVRRQLRSAGFHVDADMADRKMQKKVREAQVSWQLQAVPRELREIGGRGCTRTDALASANKR